MKKIIFTIIFIYYSNFAYCQTNYLVKESGSATAQTVSYTQQVKFTKTSGSWNSAKIIDFPCYKVINDVIKNNSLTFYNCNVSVNNGVSFTETNSTDSWGNSKSLINMTLPSSMSYNDFTLTLSYSLGTKSDISTVFNPSIGFPLLSSDVWNQKLLGYLDPTTNIESNSTEIVSMASNIVNGATNLKSAVELLASWIAANIKYQATSTTALQTFRNKYGNCQGQSCLMIAFCRSLGIPARIDCGDFFRYQMTLPVDSRGSTITEDPGTNGTFSNQTVGHAIYEVYYPSIGWVRGDPAMTTLNFGWPTFLKYASVTDPDIANKRTFSFSAPAGSNLNFSSAQSFSTTVSGFTSSFTYSSTKMISGTQNNAYIFEPYDNGTKTGFNDKVTIEDAKTGTSWTFGQVPLNTYSMTACAPANFYAKFVSETTPLTYSTSFDWSIVLYHSGGEYVYAQQNGIMTNTYTPNDDGEGCFWQPTIGILPAYNWAYDPSGNIYGKVTVTVHINDGDTKYYETSIGVSPRNDIQNITYTTDTTVNGCAELNLTNVNITGTPTVTFNTNGLGMTINGPFEAPLGSTLIINQ